MAFSVDYKGPARRRLVFAVIRQSDGHRWNSSHGWSTDAEYNKLPEQSPGRYGVWVTDTRKGETYTVAVKLAWESTLLKSYRCDSKGRPVEVDSAGKAVGPKSKGKLVNATIVDGSLYVDGKKEKPDVVLQAMSSNGTTKYTAIRWGPSGLASCNCPGWTTNAKHKGKGIADRSCKHSKQVATMKTSVYLADSTLPPTATPMPGNAERSGRGIELD